MAHGSVSPARTNRPNWLLVGQLLLTCGLLVSSMLALPSNPDLQHWPMPHNPHNQAVNQPPPAKPVKPPIPPWHFPDDATTIFPGSRLVALYGSPGAPVLGVLGRQDLVASIKRVKQLAADYQPYSKQHILPTFEIIATVASESPTDNNDYSREISPTVLRQWIDSARKAGVYVVLDLQPGRTDFLTQAKRLAPLLEQPNVGLALDPEWRLTATQVPLAQIGAVSIKEVNQTADWLASLVKQHDLPQKLFLLHQFRLDMLPGREQLDTSHTNLAYVIQMDGQGTQSQKQDTWHTILKQPPAHTKFGWKNFLIKDSHMLTPAQTMRLKPIPWYISYQ